MDSFFYRLFYIWVSGREYSAVVDNEKRRNLWHAVEKPCASGNGLSKNRAVFTLSVYSQDSVRRSFSVVDELLYPSGRADAQSVSDRDRDVRRLVIGHVFAEKRGRWDFVFSVLHSASVDSVFRCSDAGTEVSDRKKKEPKGYRM